MIDYLENAVLPGRNGWGKTTTTTSELYGCSPSRWGHQRTKKKQKLGPWEGIHPTESVLLTEMQSKMLQPLNTQGGAKPTTQTPWERPLELCQLATSVGWEYPPTTTCVAGALHLSALKGHAYSSLHGALCTTGKKIPSNSGDHVPWSGASTTKYPAVVCWMRGTYNMYNVAPKKQNLPPEWTCSRPLPRGSSDNFIGPPQYFGWRPCWTRDIFSASQSIHLPQLPRAPWQFCYFPDNRNHYLVTL